MLRQTDMTEPPYEILGAERDSPWLIVCDHASNRIPDEIGGGSLGLPEGEMHRHIAYDIGAAGVSRRLAELLFAPALLSRFSRLVIDPNRGEDDPTLIMKLYDGTIVPGNRHALIPGRPNALIELRHDLITDPVGQHGWAERLAPILEEARRRANL